MQTRHLLAATAVVSMLAAAVAFVLRTIAPASDTTSAPAASSALDLSELASLAGDADFPRPAAGPIVVQTDLAPHSDVRTEAWLLNASLTDSDGKSTDLSVTIARHGLVPEALASESPSQWQARGGWMTAIALRHGDRSLHRAERLTRDMALLRVSSAAAVTLPGLVLSARTGGFDLTSDDHQTRLTLAFDLDKPALVSEPGVAPLRAFSLTRLRVIGTLEDLASGSTEFLAGTAWLDRAWGELPLPGGATVNERYAVQLDSGAEIIVSRSWRRGSSRRRVSAQLVGADGAVTLVGPVTLDEAADALTIESSDGAVQGTLQLRERGVETLALGGGRAVVISFAGMVAGERVTGSGFGQRAAP